MNNDTEKTKEDYNDMWLSMFDQFLRSEKMILKILTACKIPFNQFEGIEKRYIIGEDRSGVIVITRNSKTGKVERTIIDIINGKHSSFQQLLDITFNVGKNCKNKIIMISGEKEDVSPPEYEEILNDFTIYINKFGQNIYQIQVDMHFITDFSGLKVLNKPPEKPEFDTSELPELRRFQNAEFWQFYYYPNSIFYPMYESEKVGDYLFYSGDSTDIGCIKIIFAWDEEGAIFTVSEDVRYSIFKKMLDDKLAEIQNKYDGKKIIVNESENGLKELKIIYDDRSVNDFYHLPLDEKVKLADLISEESSNFRSLIGEWEYEISKIENKA